MITKSKYQKFMESKLSVSGELVAPSYRAYQALLLDNLHKNRLNFIKKGRNLGVTSILAFEAMHELAERQNRSVMYLGANQAVKRNFKSIFMNAYEHNDWGHLKITRADSTEISFNNGSYITMGVPSACVGCSRSADLLLLEEISHFKNFEDVWMSIYPVTAPKGRTIIASTLGSKEDWFYKNYQDAKTNPNCAAYDLGNVTVNHDVDELLNLLPDSVKMEYGLVD